MSGGLHNIKMVSHGYLMVSPWMMGIQWVSHWYHIGITWVSHGYHMGIIVVSNTNHIGITWLSHGFHRLFSHSRITHYVVVFITIHLIFKKNMTPFPSSLLKIQNLLPQKNKTTLIGRVRTILRIVRREMSQCTKKKSQVWN